MKLKSFSFIESFKNIISFLWYIHKLTHAISHYLLIFYFITHSFNYSIVRDVIVTGFAEACTKRLPRRVSAPTATGISS